MKSGEKLSREQFASSIIICLFFFLLLFFLFLLRMEEVTPAVEVLLDNQTDALGVQ